MRCSEAAAGRAQEATCLIAPAAACINKAPLRRGHRRWQYDRAKSCSSPLTVHLSPFTRLTGACSFIRANTHGTPHAGESELTRLLALPKVRLIAHKLRLVSASPVTRLPTSRLHHCCVLLLLLLKWASPGPPHIPAGTVAFVSHMHGLANRQQGSGQIAGRGGLPAARRLQVAIRRASHSANSTYRSVSTRATATENAARCVPFEAGASFGHRRAPPDPARVLAVAPAARWRSLRSASSAWR